MTPEQQTAAAYKEFLEDLVDKALTRGADPVRGASFALVLGCLPGASPLLLEAMADAYERGAGFIPWRNAGTGSARDILDEVPGFLRHIAHDMRKGSGIPTMPPRHGRTVCFCGGLR